MRFFQLILLIIIISCRSSSDIAKYSKNDVLLTIAGTPVSAGEFTYSFKKSHQNEDSITSELIDDYLQLFINYKLKVAEAKRAGYDTIAGYKNELSLYQEQLKSSYRASEKIVDALKIEAYNHMQEEINASHILVRLPANPSPKDTLEAYQKISDLRSRAASEDFDRLAAEYSEDPSARTNKGHLGYFTAFQMVYPFEKAAYITEEGTISSAFRTNYGYHILKVHDKRPSVYSIAIDQIRIEPISDTDINAARDHAFELHDMLEKNLLPEQVLDFADKEKFQVTLRQQLKLNQIPQELVESALQLKEGGQVSDPLQYEDNWHIFILADRQDLPPYEQMEAQLDRMVRRTDRLQIYQKHLMAQLYEKHDVNITIEKENLFENWDSSIDSMTLFSVGENKFNTRDFKDFIHKKDVNTDNRIKLHEAFDRFVDQKVIQQEDEQVLAENPELRWLLKEYEEGMLLFNIMEDSVWNKAVNDKAGLEKFITASQSSTMATADSSLHTTKDNIIMNYQGYLEDKWIKRLREQYSVIINQPVLKKLYENFLD